MRTRTLLGAAALGAVASLAAIAVGTSHTTTEAAETAATVTIGLNYPETGPYAAMGLDQRRAAELAAKEINAAGGILGQQIKLEYRDTQSKKDLAAANAADLIDTHGAKMVFGGSSSAVAVAVGKVCQEKNVPFFGTLTYSNTVTGTEGHRHLFRESSNAWAHAKVLADYMNSQHAGQKYVYITADYNWGHSTEESFRTFTNTQDTDTHKAMLTPFPGATDDDFKRAIAWAKMMKPDVLVLVLFGSDMERAIRQATLAGLKSECQIVVPCITLSMAEGGGPKVMEGVIGALPWTWRVPGEFGFERGQKFVEEFTAAHDRYPSTSGASAYTILHQYKDAVERAGTFDTAAVIRALEDHSFTLLKDEQTWQAFDHQNRQTMFAVRCKPAAEVMADPFKLDYFEIIGSLSGDKAFHTHEEWKSIRVAAGKPETLGPLTGDVAGVPGN